MKGIVFVAFLLTGCMSTKNAGKSEPETTNSGKKVCPEAWYINQMPGPNAKKDEYFIYEGERRDSLFFDMSWVRKNCKITPKIVQ